MLWPICGLDGEVEMAEGYEVATDDLRAFAVVIKDEGVKVSELKARVDAANLDYDTPLVGLGFKATYSATQMSVRSAIDALGNAFQTAGQKLKEIADAYETNERNAAKALTPGKP